jgi:hypothetical protein
MTLETQEIRKLVDEWYAVLDRHAPLTEVQGFLINEGLEMRFPETTAHGHSGFAKWYDEVTNRFFDEQHVIIRVESSINGSEALVTVLVNWQARIWDPPAPSSQWLGFDADQTWVVVADRDGQGTKIKSYIVNELAPLPGSAQL